MADITLSDGREITFDFTKLTLKEYRALFDKAQAVDDEDTIVARVCGIEIDEYQSLSYADCKRSSSVHGSRLTQTKPARLSMA